MRAPATVEGPGALAHFVTTRWSLLRQRYTPRGRRRQIDPALAHLCQIYWRPIFTFIFRQGYSEADAQDLTQDFFLTIMDGNLLQAADPQRGRFRSLLLKSLQRFLIDVALKDRRHKRGGRMRFVSLDKWMADAPAQLSLPAKTIESVRPETLFDAGWAAAVAAEALRRLRLECESKGRRRVYEILHVYLTAERSDICHERLARTLRMPEPSVKRLLHLFRTRYRVLLREEVAKTVESEANVDDEIRYLCAILSADTA